MEGKKSVNRKWLAKTPDSQNPFNQTPYAAPILVVATFKDGGAEGVRTPDPHNAIVVLYQLSYDPIQSAAL